MHPQPWTSTRQDWAVFAVLATMLVVLLLFLIITNKGCGLW
ncbi:MAG: hypothetical protein ABI024_08325 [Vicinamibacterales bacterium]